MRLFASGFSQPLDTFFVLFTTSSSNVQLGIAYKKRLLKNTYEEILVQRDNVPTLAISFPIPVFAPVTMMTFPDKSGMACMNFGFGGKDCETIDRTMAIKSATKSDYAKAFATSSDIIFFEG
jgi:hypothetical protein